jgi:hypothetical protein
MAIVLERLVPYWSEEITGIFDSYRVRKEESERKNDGTTATPYKERVVLGADGEGQLVLCDMKGLKNVTKEGDEFAAYLADDQRSILHRGFELATDRAAPTPDVVFLVFDGENLSSMTDRKAALLLKPLRGVHGQGAHGAQEAAPAVPDRGDQDGQGPGSGHQCHETKGRTAHLRGLARR